MSINGAITSFLTGTYAVTRKSAGTYTAGLFTPGGSSGFNVDACVQPVSGRDLKSLPEGQRAEDARVVYTTTQIYTRTPTQEPDLITIASESYAVIKVEVWEGPDVTHYRALVARQAVP